MEYPLAPLTEEIDLPSVELPRDAGIEVKVLDEKGTPVASAKVLVSPVRPRDVYTPWRPEWQPARRLGTTGNDGRTLLPAAAGDSLRIEVSAPGLRPLASSGIRPPRFTVKLARGLERRIEVRSSRHRPAEDVLAWIDEMQMPAAASDDRGQLSLTLPPAGRESVRLLAAGGEQLVADVTPPRKAAPPGTVRLDLRPAVTLAGRVIEELRRSALPGALVWIGRDFASWVRTDRSGDYLLTRSPGNQGVVRAAASGYFEETASIPDLAAGSSPGPTFALSPKALLSGLVVDGQDRPVGDVDIRTRYDATVARRPKLRLRMSGGLTRSQVSGRFRIDNLVPGAPYMLRFAKPGFAVQLLAATAPEVGSPASQLRIVLTPGKVAFGFVRDEQEHPIPGASVELRPVLDGNLFRQIQRIREPDPALIAQASTNAAGLFEMRDLRPGRFELAVQARGFATVRVPGIEIPTERDRFDAGTVILKPEALLAGRVQSPEGRPLEGAGIRIVPSDPLTANLPGSIAGSGPPDAVSDAVGSFQLAGQRAGDHLKLTVERSGYATAELTGVPVPAPEPLVVVLSPSSRLAGRVADVEGRPLAGISLTAVSLRSVVIAGMPASSGRAFQARSRDDGSFVIEGVEPGGIELTASGEGWQDTVQNFQVPAGQNREDLEIVLRKAAHLTGQVLGPDGTPVVGAEIGHHEPDQPVTVLAFHAPLATSDGDGRFSIDGLAPGPLRLMASHTAFGRTFQELDAKPGENRVDFQFARGQTLAGQVVDGAGAPVAGARVWLRSRPSTLPSTQAMSRDDGRFTFDGLAPGAYELQAAKDGRGRTRDPAPVQIAAESPPQEVVVELASTGAIRGHILGLTPDELAQVRLAVDGASPEGVSVSYDGSYGVSGVLPGTWRIVAELPRTGRQAEGEATLEPGAGDTLLDLDFRQGLTLSGTVRRNDQPLAGGAVSLLGFGASPATSETDLQGRFSFHGLLPDHYRIEIADYRTRLVHTREIDLRQDDQVVIDIQTTGLTGIVVDELSREPVSQAEVAIVPADADQNSPVPQSTVSSGDGGFSFPEVAEGSWRLTVVKPGYSSTQRTMILDRSQPGQRVEIPLKPEKSTPSGP
jgi:hypothetical protein